MERNSDGILIEPSAAERAARSVSRRVGRCVACDAEGLVQLVPVHSGRETSSVDVCVNWRRCISRINGLKS